MPREPEDIGHSDECPECEGQADGSTEDCEECGCDTCKGEFVCECRDCRRARRDEQEHEDQRRLEEAYDRGEIRED